ncbi:MAG: hypothetical protein WBN04_20515 [Paracoccaceae bacterium]
MAVLIFMAALLLEPVVLVCANLARSDLLAIDGMWLAIFSVGACLNVAVRCHLFYERPLTVFLKQHYRKRYVAPSFPESSPKSAAGGYDRGKKVKRFVPTKAACSGIMAKKHRLSGANELGQVTQKRLISHVNPEKC